MWTSTKKKHLFVFFLFVSATSLVLIKAFYIQIYQGEKLRKYAKTQNEGKLFFPSQRGSIWDRFDSALAVNVLSYDIFTIPQKKYHKQYRKLATILKKKSNTFLKKIKNRKRHTWLLRNTVLKSSQLKKIRNLPGIFIQEHYARTYPNEKTLSHVLGHVGVDQAGLAGLEFYYEKELAGEVSRAQAMRDAKGRFIYPHSKSEENHGKDLHLTIDLKLQVLVEEALKKSIIEHNAKMAGMAVMNANTGEIYAMANAPSFNPNRKDVLNSKFPFITDAFEPGSIFKPFIIASALENKVHTPQSKIYCEGGKLQLANHTINEAEKSETFEWLTLEEIISYSSNVGITKIAFDTTFPVLLKTLKKFHFGKKTFVDFPGEGKGIFNLQGEKSSLALSNLSFGQGIAVTGIQMLAAYAPFANGGYYVRPRFNKNSPLIKKRIISSEVAKNITKMLVRAVSDGTGSNAKIRGLTIAGKTGTAQRPNQGGYKGHLSSFIGYNTGKDPLIAFVYVDDPQNGKYYGNSVAAPVFKKVMRNYHFIHSVLSHVSR